MGIEKVDKRGNTYYSIDDLNKILKEPSSVLLADKAISANGYKKGNQYIERDYNVYFFTLGALEQIVRPFHKKLNGQLAMRALKELKPAASTDTGENIAKVAETPEPDYARRLTNVSKYAISHHASKRIEERFGYKSAVQQGQWLLTMAPRLGYMGTQYGNSHEIWGNADVIIITNPDEFVVITVLEPDMSVVVSHDTYEDLDDAFSQAIHSIKLKENRVYWEELSKQLGELAEFATAAKEAIDQSRQAKSESGISIMLQTAEDTAKQYKCLTYDIDQLIAEHEERVKYIDKKA